MAYRKSCSISIGGVSDQGGGVWRCNVTHYFPPALSGYDINTFTTGDVLFEEYAPTYIRRWKVVGVGAQASPIKQYDVQWDDEGVDPGTGPTAGVNGIISQIVGTNELANQPTREYHQVPDHLRTQIVNDNDILRLADISGGGSSVIQHTLDATDISNKYADFSVTVTATTEAVLIIGGGPGTNQGTDFTVNGSGRVTWNGLGLDGILESGDNLTLIYK